MKRGTLIRQTILLVLATILISAVLTSTIYFVVAQNVFVNMRAKELMPGAERIAESILGALDNQMRFPFVEIALMDSEVRLYNSEGEPWFSEARSQEHRPRRVRRTVEGLDEMIQPQLEQVLQGESISTTSNARNMDFLIIGVPVKENDIIHGAVIMIKPLSELRTALSGLNLTLLSSVIASFVLMLIPAYLGAKKLVIPINQMKNTAIAIAGGDFSVRANQNYSGEIGELADALNYMSGELSKLEQTRRDYVSNVSHELRTPISSIRAMSETLIDGLIKDEDTKNRYYGNMLRESLRLSRLIDDLLELSRLQSGTLAFKKSKTNIIILLTHVADIYRIKAEDADIEFRFNPGNGGDLFCNSDRIEQILNILLDNAIKFTPSGGCVTLGYEPTSDNFNLYVEDTGVGIEPEDLPHIFDRFYKADKSHSCTGTGLGLSIANELAQLMGESLTVQSTFGVGSRFTLTVAQVHTHIH